MSSIPVIDKKNSLNINNQSKNNLNVTKFQSKKNLSLSKKSYVSGLNKKNISNNITKNQRTYRKNSSSMPIYSFSKDIKPGYYGTVINSNGTSDTLRIVPLLDPIEDNKNIEQNYNSKIIKENLNKQGDGFVIHTHPRGNNSVEHTYFIKEPKMSIIRDNESDTRKSIMNFLNERIEFFGNRDSSPETPWKISYDVDESIQDFGSMEKLQDSFNYLKGSSGLNPNFLNDIDVLNMEIDGKKIKKSSSDEMLKKFKEIVPDLSSQQLISTYANRVVLAQPYLSLLHEHPDLTKFRPENSKLFCKIKTINHDTFEILVTDMTELHLTDEPVDTKYNLCGARSALIVSKHKMPELQHLIFIK